MTRRQRLRNAAEDGFHLGLVRVLMSAASVDCPTVALPASNPLAIRRQVRF